MLRERPGSGTCKTIPTNQRSGQVRRDFKHYNPQHNLMLGRPWHAFILSIALTTTSEVNLTNYPQVAYRPGTYPDPGVEQLGIAINVPIRGVRHLL